MPASLTSHSVSTHIWLEMLFCVIPHFTPEKHHLPRHLSPLRMSSAAAAGTAGTCCSVVVVPTQRCNGVCQAPELLGRTGAKGTRGKDHGLRQMDGDNIPAVTEKAMLKTKHHYRAVP